MKDRYVESCIGYLRFGYDFDGLDFPQLSEQLFTKILEGDESANDAIEDYKRRMNLSDSYDASFDEFSLYPDTRCLVNYFNIKDKSLLKKAEMFISSVRICELLEKGQDDAVTDFNYLRSLHSVFFGDIYPSAGAIRTKSISRKTEFCRPEYIEKMGQEIFRKLSDASYLKGIEDQDDFINELAYFMGEVEALHPFMEGNGRTSRFFFTTLALNAGYEIHWENADADNFLEANIAAIEGDYQPLVDVLEEIIIRKED